MRDRALVLRAQEILANSDKPTTAPEAFEQAFRERYPDATVDDLIRVLAAMASSMSKSLRKHTYEMQEPGQISLIPEIPAMIAISTPSGDLFMPKNVATTGQVKQWRREGRQYHSVQSLRFDRLGEDLETYAADIDDDVPWLDAAEQIADRKRAALELGQYEEALNNAIADALDGEDES